MDNTKLIEEEIARGFVDHDVNDRIPTVEGEAMSEGSIEKVDNAMEELAREGIRFIFGLSEFHGGNDGFVDAQVCTGGRSGGGFAPFFEETEPFFEGDSAQRKGGRIGGYFGLEFRDEDLFSRREMKGGEAASASKNGTAQCFGARPSYSIQGGLGKGSARGLGKVLLVSSQDGRFKSFPGRDQGGLDGGGVSSAI